jgi:hypothetical protein
MPRLAAHLGQNAGGAEAYGGRGAGDSLFVEAGDVRVQCGEVLYEVRVATRY